MAYYRYVGYGLIAALLIASTMNCFDATIKCVWLVKPNEVQLLQLRWMTGGLNWTSHSLNLNLRPDIFKCESARLTLCGVDLHYQRSTGGYYV